jgi:hypothetical protein
MAAAALLAGTGFLASGPHEYARAAVAPSAPVGPAPTAVARDLVDVALLPVGGADGAPRLLTVAEDRSVYGRIRLSVLERGGGRWSPRAELLLEPPVLAQTGTPWLVALDDHRFAVLAVAPELDETWVRVVTWTGEELRRDRVAGVRALIDDAGVSDVDGDGTRELVLAQTATRRGGPTCQGSRVLTLDPATLGVLYEFTLQNIRLAAGALGNLDGEPGDELVASAFSNCPAGPGSAERAMAVAVRLRDGESLFGQGTTPADLVAAWSGWPLIADLEQDGRPEVLLGSLMGLTVLSPQAGWTVDAVPSLPGVLLGAARGPGGTVVAAATGDRLSAGRLRATSVGWRADPVGGRDEASAGSVQWDAAAVDRRSSWLSARPLILPSTADRDCEELIVPLAALRCDPGTGAWRLAPAPAWFATRIVAALGPGGPSPGGFLVAHADAWPGVPSRLVAPAPLASAHGTAVWRNGPSGAFSLHEVSGTIDSLAAPGSAPSVVPVLTGDPPALEAQSAVGSRLVLAIAPGPAATTAAAEAPSLHRLLARGSPPDGELSLHRIEPAQEAGTGTAPPDPESGNGSVRVPLLPSGSVEDGTWSATAIAIDAVGNVSAATGQRVSTDYAAPRLALEPSMLTAPWPFQATLSGVTEPGVDVSVAGRPVDVAADGSFSVDAVLAPWPQRLELRARDVAGNETVVRPDVVGGFDYRRLPWIAILVGGVLLWATVAGIRTLRRPTSPRPAAAATDAPTLEELDPGAARPER